MPGYICEGKSTAAYSYFSSLPVRNSRDQNQLSDFGQVPLPLTCNLQCACCGLKVPFLNILQS